MWKSVLNLLSFFSLIPSLPSLSSCRLNMLFSFPLFHPFIPVSHQSRRQQDPSPGSNMANADMEHKMRWGGGGGGGGSYARRKSREPVPAVHSLSMQSTEKELNETAVVDQLFLTMKVSRDHFYMRLVLLFSIFECRWKLIELKVNKNPRKKGRGHKGPGQKVVIWIFKCWTRAVNVTGYCSCDTAFTDVIQI